MTLNVTSDSNLNSTSEVNVHTLSESSEGSGLRKESAVVSTSTSTLLGGKRKPEDGAEEGATKKDIRFWALIGVINLCYFLSLLEATSISTALPTISASLNGADFIWVGSAYNIASTAFMPITGGLSQIFGRRPVLLVSIIIFAVGSLVCALATSMNMLIAARVVQGSGAAGLTTVSSIILSDVVSLKERGVYNGLIQLTWALAAGVGPAVGGALARAGAWRWIFYLNLPLSGIVFLLTMVFLNLKTPPGSFSTKLRMIDWVGSFLIVASSVSVAIGLTWAGVDHPWRSAPVLVPLILGALGISAFFLYETMICQYPIVPWEAVSNRTSLSGYLQIFFAAVPFISLVYYLPVWFQACHASSALQSGIQLFPCSFTIAPFSIVIGISITKTGRYRPQLWMGWVIVIVSLALMTTVHASTRVQVVLGYEAVIGFGFGIVYSGTWFPVLSPLGLDVTPKAIAFFAFVRQFATVWAVTIGGAVLQNYIVDHLPATLGSTSNVEKGSATFYTLISTLGDLPEGTRDLVREAIGEGIRRTWIVMVGIAGLGMICSFGMRGLPLSGKIDDKWGIKEEPIVEKNSRDV